MGCIFRRVYEENNKNDPPTRLFTLCYCDADVGFQSRTKVVNLVSYIYVHGHNCTSSNSLRLTQ